MPNISKDSDNSNIALNREFLRCQLPEQLTELISKGVDLNTTDSVGRTKLHCAVEHKQYAIISLLLAAGADPNRRCTNFNNTPLALAIKEKDEKAILTIVLNSPKLVTKLATEKGLDILYENLCEIFLERHNSAELASHYHVLKKTKEELALLLPEISKFFPILPYSPSENKHCNDSLALLHIFLKASVFIRTFDSKHLCHGPDENHQIAENPAHRTAFISQHLLNIFNNIGSNYFATSKALMQFPREDFLHTKDFLFFTYHYLVAPEILNQLTPRGLPFFTQYYYNLITNDLLPSWLNYLTSERNIFLIQSLSQIWHNDSMGFADLARDFAEKSESWAAIIPNSIAEVTHSNFEDWKIVNLSTSNELMREAKILNHCVHGYTERCLSGRSHIFSIRDKNNIPQSTFEFQISTNNPNDIFSTILHDNSLIIPNSDPKAPQRILIVNQHHGEKNGRPSSQCLEIFNNFISEIKSGKYDLMPQNSTNSQSDQDISFLENHLGIRKSELNSERKQKLINLFTGRNDQALKLRVGRKKSLVPRAYSEKGYDAFFEDSGLRSKIATALEELRCRIARNMQ